jgi:hypothetical protein
MEYKEIFMDVVGYEGHYQISNLGRVKSLDKKIVYSNGGVRIHKGKILCQSKRGEYYKVTLTDQISRKTISNHRLVCDAFLPNPKNLPQVNHIDGNKLNNNLNNLEWVCAKINKIHSYEIGLSPKGQTHYKTKLSRNDASCIKYGYDGFSQKEIARIYNIKQSTVSAIRKGRNWKHI